METRFLEIKIDPETNYESVGFKINNGAGSVSLVIYDVDTNEFLVRKERVPAWSNKNEIVSLAGLIEPGENPVEAVIRECREESGYIIDEEDIECFFSGFLSKKDRDMHYAFAMGITEADREELEKNAVRISGDGTEIEKQASVQWLPYVGVEKSNDAVLCMSINYLYRML